MPAVSKRRPWWKRAIKVLLWIFTVFFSAGLFIASYCGDFEPSEFSLAAVMLLSYPAWLLGVILFAVLDALWCRKVLFAAVVTVAACIPSIWEYSPLNVLPVRVPAESEGRTFKFMSYNVAAFHNFSDSFPGGVNPTMSYILNSGADIINLQEVYIFATSKGEHITSAQIDSIYKIYPYVLIDGISQALLSKYPAKAIRLDWPYAKGNEISAFRIDIDGTPVTLFNVHLQSYGLTDADKSLFRSLTRLHVYDPEKMDEIKRQLLDKVNAAAAQRAFDAVRLGHYMRRVGGPNIIVAGDFNDVPGCYALHYLEDFGLHQVYPEVGFGPMITYNSDRFYFRIDHVLYRGALKPFHMTRGHVDCSDHYPVKVDFALTSPAD